MRAVSIGPSGLVLIQRSAQSTLTNKSRLRLLQQREQHLQDLFSDAKERLVKLSEDQAKYSQLLESSILEVWIRTCVIPVALLTKIQPIGCASSIGNQCNGVLPSKG